MADSRMTVLEKAKLRRLELENERLRAQHARMHELQLWRHWQRGQVDEFPDP